MGLKVKGYPVPDSWAKCSTGTFQQMVNWEPEKDVKDRDRVKLYSILCNQPYELLTRHKDEHLDALLWEASRFVYEENSEFDKLPLPAFLETHGKHIVIPKDLGKLTIGQNIHIRQAINSGVDPNGLISLVVAIYLQPLIDSVVTDGRELPGIFNFERAQEIEERIKALPIKKTYPIGFFFLKKLRPFGTGYIWNLLLTLRMKTNAVLSLLNLRRLRDLPLIGRLLYWTGTLRHMLWTLTMFIRRNLIPYFYF